VARSRNDRRSSPGPTTTVENEALRRTPGPNRKRMGVVARDHNLVSICRPHQLAKSGAHDVNRFHPEYQGRR